MAGWGVKGGRDGPRSAEARIRPTPHRCAVLAAALVLGLSFGCSAADPHDLQEAALRWAFANADTNLDPPAAHCLAASPASLEDGHDPDPAFLARFTEDGVPVRPVSACRLEDDPVNGVRDASTGEHALLFTISPIVPDDPERPTVEVGFLQGSLWGTGWRCAFVRNEQAWELEECVRILNV